MFRHIKNINWSHLSKLIVTSMNSSSGPKPIFNVTITIFILCFWTYSCSYNFWTVYKIWSITAFWMLSSFLHVQCGHCRNSLQKVWGHLKNHADRPCSLMNTSSMLQYTLFKYNSYNKIHGHPKTFLYMYLILGTCTKNRPYLKDICQAMTSINLHPSNKTFFILNSVVHEIYPAKK